MICLKCNKAKIYNVRSTLKIDVDWACSQFLSKQDDILVM
jgi:hypothetical protein